MVAVEKGDRKMNKHCVLNIKTIALCFSIFICIPHITWAQEKDVVYLTNGSVIKGNIIEQIPGKTITIETEDGSTFVFKMDEIAKIGKEKKKDVAPDLVAELLINTQPEDADIRVNGIWKGKSPILLNSEVGETLEIEAKKANLYAAREIQIESEGRTEIEIVMQERDREGFSVDASAGVWYWYLNTQMVAFRLNLIYQFNNIVSFGGGLGLDITWYGQVLPNVGIGVIFGNKVDGIAFSVDLNLHFISSSSFPLWPSLGIYFYNAFFKITPMFVAGFSDQMFIEIGYSFFLGD